MNESRRQKKVSSLLKGVLSQHLPEVIQGSSAGLISITEIDMSKDLKTAHVYLSLFETGPKEQVLDAINKKAGYFRKVVASKTDLKYNPKLIFLCDPMVEYEIRLNQLIDKIKKDGKSN